MTKKRLAILDRIKTLVDQVGGEVQVDWESLADVPYSFLVLVSIKLQLEAENKEIAENMRDVWKHQQCGADG
jgi:hypothetical protein